MEDLLNKGPVKRVQEFIKKFDPKLKVLVLNTTARTAKDAASSLKCEVGAIVKSLLFKVDGNFLICLIAGDKRCSLNKLKKDSSCDKNILPTFHLETLLSIFTSLFFTAIVS